MGVLCSWGEGTRTSHGNGAPNESVGSGDRAFISIFLYLRDDFRRVVHDESTRALFSDDIEVCGEGLGVRFASRRPEDKLKSYFRFCDEHAKESFAVSDSPLIAGMLHKESCRPFVGFKSCSKAALKLVSRVGVVTLVG